VISPRHAATAVVATLCFLVVAAPSALAANLTPIDPHAATPGHLLTNPATGATVVAWTTKLSDDQDGVPMVCVIPHGGACTAPRQLTVPDSKNGPRTVTGLFPVAGPGAIVDLVAPTVNADNVAVKWESTDGGATFSGATIVAAGSPSMTESGDVVRSGAQTYISSANVGVGFGTFGTQTGNFSIADPGDDVGLTSSLALDANGFPVITWFTDPSDRSLPDVVKVERYTNPAKPLTKESPGWSGAQTVAAGYEPVLSGGASGLFMASEDPAAGGATPILADTPMVVNVRKDAGGAFGAPLTLAIDGAGDELYEGGAIAQSPAGRIAVAWPGAGIDGRKVMRLFASTDGGRTFSGEQDIATVADGYRTQRNAQLALSDNGEGIVTFLDEGGLELANLDAIAPITPPTPEAPAPPAPTHPLPGIPVYNPTRGPFASTNVNVGTDTVTLQTPGGCVRSGTIAVRLLIHARHKHQRVVLKVRKVQVRFDRRYVRSLVRKPFTLRFKVKIAPRSRHTLSARIFYKTRHGKRAYRILSRTFVGCAS